MEKNNYVEKSKLDKSYDQGYSDGFNGKKFSPPSQDKDDPLFQAYSKGFNFGQQEYIDITNDFHLENF